MQWVEDVTWAPGGYKLHTRTRAGHPLVQPMSELQSVVCEPEDRGTRLRGETDFSAWQVLPADEVALIREQLGFPDGATGQDFYRFSCVGQMFVVPASVLMCAMFRPFHGMARYVFAPQGLDNLFVPASNTERPELLFFRDVRTSTEIQPHNAEGILNSLSWMYCFPSARGMWNSVLVHARGGNLRMDLPLGKLTFTGRGTPVGNILFVAELQLKLLKTEESPRPMFSEHVRVIEFQRIPRSKTQPSGKLAVQLEGLPSRNGDYSLSDDEWADLKDVMNPTHASPRQYELRAMIDNILEKLGKGLPWDHLSGGLRDSSPWSKTYYRMKADDRWDTLLAVLWRHRCRVEVEAHALGLPCKVQRS
jgi:hypothetical protein